MKPQEISIGSKTTINVVLIEDAFNIEEVVAVGYATVAKKDLTGSISSIGQDALTARPITNFVDALQGKASGVALNSTSGEPGSSVQVRIRGLGSINSSVDPLYVIDGLPFTGDLSSINANDIESIEILKDASSTAIYGSRGANGVILISTKKGSNKGLVIDFNSSYGVQNLRKKIDLLNATQYAELANAVDLSVGNPATYSAAKIASFNNGGKGTDWQNEIYQTAPIQIQQLSASGGNDKMKFYMSGNYLNQDGIIKTSNFEKYSLRVNLDANINDKISVGNTLSVSRQSRSGVPTSSSTRSNTGSSNVVWAALVANPTLEIQDKNGNYIQNFPDPVMDNPVALLNNLVNESKTNEVIGSLYLKYNFLEWLSFKSTFGFGLNDYINGSYTNKSIIGSGNGRASRSTSQSVNWVSTNQFDFKKEFAEKHKIYGNLVAEAQKYTIENFSASSEGYVLDNLTYNSLGSASNPLTPSSGASKWSLASFAARANYVNSNKYYLTLTGRYDGASRLAKGNKWKMFPSGAISWRISEEPFMSNFSSIDDLKLRASYGESGSQSVDVYNTLSQMYPDMAIIGSPEVQRTGYSAANFPNQNLTWEISKQMDLGFNISLLGRAIAIDVDYFDRKTEGLFFGRDLPAVVGTNNLSTTTNIGSVKNSGVEAGVEANILIKRNLKWKVNGNFTFSKSKVLALAENDTIYTGFAGEYGESTGSQILAVGGEIGVFRGWLTDGLYGNDLSLTVDGGKRSPGDRKYVDVNRDGDVNSKDRVILGNAVPKFFWGLTNTFIYKGLSLSIFLQGSHGNKIANLNRATYLESLDGKTNDMVSSLNRWTTTNTVTNIPRATAVRPPLKFSDAWLEDGSYIRLKSITFGYDLPRSILNRIGFRSLKLFFTGTNLITFSKYSGYDPDVSRSSSVTVQGYDLGIYPIAKSYVLGINLGI
jgi:TonB-linked SusC/RagA family outer membrane protein